MVSLACGVASARKPASVESKGRGLAGYPLTLTVLLVATAVYGGFRLRRLAGEVVETSWNCDVCGFPVEGPLHCPRCGSCCPLGCGMDHGDEDQHPDPWSEYDPDDEFGGGAFGEGEGVDRG